MPDSGTQARTSRITRFPQPHDSDGRPCLPTHHPRSQPPWPTSPTPTRSNFRTPTPLTCSPTSPLSRPASCAWPPPPAGRHPGAGRRRGAGRRAVDRRDRRRATDAPQPVRAALGARPDAPDHFVVPAEATIRRTLTRLDADALAAAVGTWLDDRDRERDARAGQTRSQPAAGGRHRRQDPPRRPRGRRRRPPGAPAGLHGPRHPRGASPTPGRRRTPRGPRLRSTAGPTRPGRDRGHRRRPPDPPRGRRVPGRRQARPLPVLWQGQPAHPAGALHRPGIASRCWTAPATAATARVEVRTSRPSASTASAFPMPPRSPRSPARPVPCAPHGGSRP